MWRWRWRSSFDREGRGAGPYPPIRMRNVPSRSAHAGRRRRVEGGDRFLQGSVPLGGRDAVAEPVHAQSRHEPRVDVDEDERDASGVEVVEQGTQAEAGRIV